MKVLVVLSLFIASSFESDWNPIIPSRSGYIPPGGVNLSNPLKPLADFLEAHRAQLNSVNLSDIDGGKLTACWKDSFGRGVGRPIHACPDDKEKDAGLCYPYCREGYDGVGPVCWEKCRPGYTNTGATCGKSGKIISSNNKACPWYDICGLTFEKGCSFCPDHDPPYKNDGCTCRIDPHVYAKHSYGRGVGKPMGCSSDEEYDAGLCYDPCPKGYYGVGPVCWQECPRARPYDAGAVCCVSKGDCNGFIIDATKAVLALIAAAIEAGLMPWKIEELIKQILETAGAFVLLSCKRFTLG